MKFFSDIRLLILALWLGAAVFFIAVAQSAFSVLPDRQMAAAVVNSTLRVLNFGGLGIVAILLLTSVIGSAKVSSFWLWVERILLILLGAACAVGQFLFGFWLGTIRTQIDRPIEQLADDDPLKMQFMRLHEYSIWVLAAGMIAAVIAFFIIANRKFGKTKKDGDVYDFSNEFKN